MAITGKELGAQIIQNGLTKREIFAAYAMQGAWFSLTDNGQGRHIEHAAKMSVRMADALLEELAKECK